MAATRLLMRRLREILRLKYDAGLSHRAIAQACTVGLGTVSSYLTRATAAGLTWPLARRAGRRGAGSAPVYQTGRRGPPRRPGGARVGPAAPRTETPRRHPAVALD